jgi:hypothetical protein
MIPVMGDFVSEPVLSWYLKKDFKEDIFRLIDFEVIFCSFKLVSQERINVEFTELSGVSPKLEFRKPKNWSRSSLYALTVWDEYLFSNFK